MPKLPAERRAAQLNRDAALRRIVRARTGLILGSAGVTAGIAVFVADTAPGKTYKRGSRTHVVRAAALPPLASPRQLGLRPAQHPTAAAQTSPPSASTATQPTATATQPTATATQPTATAPPVSAPAAPGPVVSGGS